MVASLYTVDNPVFTSFCFHSALLCLKVLLMSLLTGKERFQKKVFANEEDTKLAPGGKVKADQDVERIRRAHLNDLENILPFLALAFVYVGTNPTAGIAVTAFRIFTIARLLHTFVYAIVVIPQPARVLAFAAGMAVNVYLGLSIIATYWSSM
nr:mGST1-like protein 2 [Diaphanosoma celebensis]